jgi:hypothetical protein
MVGLSDAWSGVIQDTASTSTLVALLCARERASNYAMSRGGLQGEACPLVVYASAHAHSSVEKAALLAGFGRENLRLVPHDEHFAMRPEALAELVDRDARARRVPCAVVATTGTTSTAALDPVNAIAAVARYGGPCVVVDFGTATTYDAISGRGELLGTVIAPGLQASGAALFSATARLPRVELAAPRHTIGKNTVEALQSGIVLGTAAEVDGVVERIKVEIGGDAKVIATGGLAPIVLPHCRVVDQHDPWLTLEGLRLIFERNAGSHDE